MPEGMHTEDHGRAGSGPRLPVPDPVVEEMNEAECLRLVSQHEVGRIAYCHGRFGPTVLPVNYRLYDGSIVFRTGRGSPMDEDLRTGIADAEYKIAFEIDDVDPASREGWSVLIQGSAHHVTSEEERAAVAQTGVSPWAGGSKELYVRIRPTRITGRHIRHAGPAAAPGSSDPD
jgi:nitroimidazol reductase NimA-like FMN-containing flavoprotein (pyridoxamine 5'-phosphate oxidase superfamily)